MTMDERNGQRVPFWVYEQVTNRSVSPSLGGGVPKRWRVPSLESDPKFTLHLLFMVPRITFTKNNFHVRAEDPIGTMPSLRWPK